MELWPYITVLTKVYEYYGPITQETNKIKDIIGTLTFIGLTSNNMEKYDKEPTNINWEDVIWLPRRLLVNSPNDGDLSTCICHRIVFKWAMFIPYSQLWKPATCPQNTALQKTRSATNIQRRSKIRHELTDSIFKLPFSEFSE